MFENLWGGHHTFQFRTFGQMFKLEWGHSTQDVLEAEGGHRTFHLKVSGQMFKLRWGHRTRSKPSKLRWRVGGWMDGWVITGNNATL